MPTQLVTPVGRLVQGGFKLQVKKDDNDQPVYKDGQPVMETFIAIAVAKDNPDWNRFHAELYAVARAECAQYFNPQTGACTHPNFSWKIKDGDGVDGNGQALSGKPGFAGHWIINCTTQFMPGVYHEGKFASHEIIQNPDEVVKKGYYVRAFVRVAGNGVTPQDKNRKPGVFVSQELVSLVGYGEVINSGPDAQKAFGDTPAAYIPPGMSQTPTVGAGAAPGLSPPPMPGVGLPPPGGVPAGLQMPGAAPTLPPPPAVTLPPPPAAAPVYTMTAKAQGATREQLHAINWTDEALIANGLMVVG
jgi:hypothetical protein